MTERSWDDLRQPRGTQEAAKTDSEFDAVCARLFTTSDGKLLISELRKKHFEGPFNALAESRALRVRIVSQQFVRDLELACERGLEANVKRKP